MPVFSPQPIWSLVILLTVTSGLSTQLAFADELPTREILEAIFPNGEMPQKPRVQIGISFAEDEDHTDAACGLKRVDLIETKGDERRRFGLLVDPVGSTPVDPATFLVKLSRLTVDIDGSGRAYHPEDPTGTGVCSEVKERGTTSLQGICALAPLSSAEVRVFRGTEHLRIFEKGKSNPDFASAWSDIWDSIKARQLHRIDLKGLVSDAAAEKSALFYSKGNNTAVVFDTHIIPFRNDYPCLHERTPYEGYFVAATTLRRYRPRMRVDACDPSQFLDAQRIPFVVVPENVFGNVALGDIVVGYARVGQEDRLVYGIVGDTGPTGQIGEASIAFVSRLLNHRGEPMNASAVSELDVDLEKPDAEHRDISSVAILVIGKTAKLLRGNYSPGNIERTGKRAFAKWAGAVGAQRLTSCVENAKANPLKGSPE
jgi:hypothetical protein